MNTIFNFLTNGRIFPIWILQHFKEYKLDILNDLDIDPCKKKQVLELELYKKFIGEYINKTNMKDILIYHGLGTGKTVTAINILNILYNKYNNINCILLIKKSLKNDPWINNLNVWLSENKEDKFKNIHWVFYDSPKADVVFFDLIKNININNKNLFIFDEVHNFISGVYNNIKSNKFRLLSIYNYIINEKKNNTNNNYVILLSGTPIINNIFELGLIFNLLRPNLFPNTENKFNELFIKNDETINTSNINLFQRRILGLVSYYKGEIKNTFAVKNIILRNINMKYYQSEVYKHYLSIENKMLKKSKNNLLFSIYTRLVCNFALPELKTINAYSRFKIIKEEDKKDYEDQDIDDLNINNEIKKYFDKINDIDIENKYTINNDLQNYIDNYIGKPELFFENNNIKKSNLLVEFLKLSCKITYLIFDIFNHIGPVLIFSNFVNNEGLQIIKTYLHYIDFTSFNDNIVSKHKYVEFNGSINDTIRKNNLNNFNNIKNIDGSYIKVILLSPAGSEGLNLSNVVSVHILDPYWNNVRIEQVVGRAIRYCSHKDLPLDKRVVNIYKYYSITQDIETTDIKIKNIAYKKENINNQFLKYIQQSAFDCELFYNQNFPGGEFNCFKFSNNNYLTNNYGPAYKKDIELDKKYNDGLNYVKNSIKKVKVIEVNAIIKNNDGSFGNINKYWYDNKRYILYDYENNYPVGKIETLIFDNKIIPDRYDINTYILKNILYVPDL